MAGQRTKYSSAASAKCHISYENEHQHFAEVFKTPAGQIRYLSSFVSWYVITPFSWSSRWHISIQIRTVNFTACALWSWIRTPDSWCTFAKANINVILRLSIPAKLATCVLFSRLCLIVSFHIFLHLSSCSDEDVELFVPLFGSLWTFKKPVLVSCQARYYGHLHFEPPSLVEIVLAAVLAVLPILFTTVVVVAPCVSVTVEMKTKIGTFPTTFNSLNLKLNENI